jgi:sulfoxide reductase heme-binding subunit YedZ
MRGRTTRWLILLTHIGAWLPLVLLAWQLWRGTLSVNPIRDVTLRTGKYALVLLVLSLACTPINTLFGYRPVLRVRKPLGLYAALYAGLHFLTFAAWDYGLQLDLIWIEIVQRPYIQVGLLTFVILILLAGTSTRGWVRRLGKGWKWLHRLAYIAGLLAVLHYLLVVKTIRPEPLIYAAIVALLLVLRIPAVARAVRRLRTTEAM